MPAIPCPNCKSQIQFEVKDILEGKEFACITCNLQIELAYDDNKKILSQATEELDKLKDELGIE